jgi:hypothetical protein
MCLLDVRNLTFIPHKFIRINLCDTKVNQKVMKTTIIVIVKKLFLKIFWKNIRHRKKCNTFERKT